MRGNDLVTFHLLVDEFLQRRVVVVFKLLGLELASLALNQLDGEGFSVGTSSKYTAGSLSSSA